MKNKLIYDYIVVGTGPAGAVIAKTLTDDTFGKGEAFHKME